MMQPAAKFHLSSPGDSEKREREGGGSGVTQVARVHFGPLNPNGIAVRMKTSFVTLCIRFSS